MISIRKLVTRSLVTLMAFSIALAACRQSTAPAAKDRSGTQVRAVSRIGAILPLTGDYGPYGNRSLKALKLGLADGGLAPSGFTLTVEDDGADTTRAVSAISKLLDVDRVGFIVGPFPSGGAQAVIPKLAPSGAILISPAATAPSLSGAAPNFFRTCPSDTAEARVVAQQIHAAGLRSVAVVYVRNEYGEQLRRTFEESAGQAGLKVAMVESFVAGAKDVRGPVTKAIESKAEAAYFIGYDELQPLLMTLVARGDPKKQRVFTNVMINNPKILAALRECQPCRAWSVEYPAWTSGDPSQEAALKSFEQRIGEQSDPFAINSYNAGRVIAAVLREPSLQSIEARIAWMRQQVFKGLSGDIRFDGRGDVELPVKMMEVF